MTYSFNEIESLSKRAARGAGYHWGHAEEAGKAARWLSEQDLAGPEMLADWLILNDGKRYEDGAPSAVNGLWRARTGELCPLLTGSALNDRAAEIARGDTLEFVGVAYPLLLVPYAASVSEALGTSLDLAWDAISVQVTANGIAVSGDDNVLMVKHAHRVTCRTTGASNLAVTRPNCRRAVDAKAWGVLTELAHRTLAPATDESRLAGAGPGSTDNE